MTPLKDIRNKYAAFVGSAIVGAALTYSFSYFFDVKPYISKTNSELTNITSKVNLIEDRLVKIDEKYIINGEDGEECRVGYSRDLSKNEVSVYAKNKFNLKRGDRIELTYPFGSFKTTAELIVGLVEDVNANSDADFFISKECLDILQVPKDRHNKGIFFMNFKRIENKH